MNQIISFDDRCTGCGLCESVCPKQAISFVDSETGFPVPKVNPDVCVHCGICARSCEKTRSLTGSEEHEYYEAWIHQDKERRHSTSGGIVIALAKHILSLGGIVFGVTMEGAERPHYISVDKEEELVKIRGARYLQADASGCYRKLKEELRRGRSVLFIGMGCHARAVRSLCGNRYPNLLLVDLACFGVPSSLLFSAFLREKEVQPQDVEDVLFRHKRFGWRDYGMLIRLRSGEEIFTPRQQSSFMQGFISPLSLRASCYSCKSGIDDRLGDITLGDLWGRPKQPDEENGVSFVITHTEQGKNAIDSIRHMIHLQAVSRESVERDNGGVVAHEYIAPEQRVPFLHELASDAPLHAILQRYLAAGSLRKGLIIGRRFYPFPMKVIQIMGAVKKLLKRLIGRK